MNSGKYAILGDIHGNLEALSAVLEDARQQEVKGYACVGDIVGYNANPAECIEQVRKLGCVTVRGNHDHYCSHDESLDDFHPLAANVVDWTRRQLSGDQVEYLRGLSLSRILAGVTLVHSTLDTPENWGYVFDELEAETHFSYQSTALCFYGHTHIPVVFEKGGRVTKDYRQRVRLALGKKYFVNVGSIGQPRDGDPRSSYVIYDATRKELEFRRIAYDVDTAQRKIRSVGLPERLARRLARGK